MRDERDSHTADLFPKKRGRPCMDGDHGPMTPAERARRFRHHRQLTLKRISRQAATATSEADQSAIDGSDSALLDAIRQELNLLARTRANPGNRSTASLRKRLGVLAGELAKRYPPL